MSHKIVKPLALAIGTGLIGSLSLAQIAQANPSFHMNSLVAGYSLAVAGEGKCGEGKCGPANLGTNGKMSKAQFQAHAEEMFAKMDANKDGMVDQAEWDAAHAAHAKGKEGSCSADKKAKGKEGSCSGEKKGKEGSCSH